MKIADYKAMLKAVESALEICRDSSEFMDEMHRKICDDLSDARQRLQQLIAGPELRH